MRTGAFVTSLTLLLLMNDRIIYGQLPLSSFENYSSRCPDSCEDEGDNPVCGSDGRTYDSQCELERARCEGHPVEFSYRGKCVDDNKRCFTHRRQADPGIKESSLPFVPKCNEDGSFAQVQCYMDRGTLAEYCWCVNSKGKPVPGTTVKNAQPDCHKEIRITTKKRPPRGKKGGKKGCGTLERTEMNGNLLDIFKSEYNRFPQPTDNIDVNNILFDTEKKRIIQWKFTELDLNSDGYLRKNELKDLKRMVKKIVKPKVCSKTFTKYCDLDEDKKITRTEWSACLGLDLNNEQGDVPSQMTTLDETEGKLSPPWGEQMPRLKTGLPIEETSFSEEDEPQDCLAARSRALELEAREPNTGQFVPECSSDGYYRQTQCHKQDAIGNLLCWCVHTRTGIPIEDTTSLTGRPDCSKKKKYKGCSLSRKQQFLDELLKFFTEEMAENKTRSKSHPPTQEQIVRWKFDLMDVNKNKLIDRKEWILFREQWKDFQKVNKRKKLRKCWRNLPKFCDDDKDAKVSIDEWLKCTEVTRDSKGGASSHNRKRGMQNPFTRILQAD